MATHIVGGQLEMLQLGQPGVFRYRLTVYQDNVSTIRELASLVAVYRKRDNALMDTVMLPVLDTVALEYDIPPCVQNTPHTTRWRYEHIKIFNPNRYSDSQGYYVVWQWCCRNGAVTNLVSPLLLGQTYYVEFPAVSSASSNSSPAGFEPLRTIACVGGAYTIPFGGTDPDGDSLTYELTTPLNSAIVSRLQIPTPQPWQECSWATGFNHFNQIPGRPGLSVDRFTGALHLTPSTPGLFAFAIRVREFRNGQQIGEVNRDFQLLVVTCPANSPPALRVTGFGDAATAAPLAPDGTLELPPPGVAADRCLNLIATDRDPATWLRLHVVALDSVTPLPKLSVTQRTINTGSRPDSLTSRLCFDACTDVGPTGVRLLLIVTDVRCPEYAADTVLLRVRSPMVSLVSAIPNVFTPDADGLNDVFQLDLVNEPLCVPVVFRRLRVYNRWGRQVFESGEAAAWSGAGCSAGLYYYLAAYDHRTVKGWVELVR